MFIPPDRLKYHFARSGAAQSAIRLRASHLLIDTVMAQRVFGDTANAYLVYYPERHVLMLASVEDELFKSLHKASQHLLKDRNRQGDKSIALHETLIDHQIPAADRDLEYEFAAELGVLTVFL